MKNKIINSGLSMLIMTVILTGCSTAGNITQAQPAVSASITYQTFYDELSPYGTWIDYPGYGHVWNPRLASGFRPYATNGHWAYSNEGWAWASSYNWGWAPFHYGRWLYDDMYGWLWIPGYDWSPAWVTWGSVDNYYAWAPLMPEVNVGISFGGWRPHDFYWNVCGRDHIYDRNIDQVIEKPEVIRNISNRITVINNYNTTNVHNLYYSKGPAVGEVEKYTNHKIEPVTIKEVNHINDAKHEGNELRVYRPKVQNAQPNEFRKVETVKPVRDKDEWPSSRQEDQRNNIDRLPVQKSMNSPMIHNNERGGRRPR